MAGPTKCCGYGGGLHMPECDGLPSSSNGMSRVCSAERGRIYRHRPGLHCAGVRGAHTSTCDGLAKPGWAVSSTCAAAGNVVRRYGGMTIEAYEQMIAKGCWLCGSRERLAVDHDHSCCPGQRTCGQCTRGVLCFICNAGLGRLGDSEAGLLRALEYLRSYAARRAAS